MRRWRSALAAIAFLLAVAGVAAGVSALGGGGALPEEVARPPASAWQGLVGSARPRVALGQRVVVLLKAPALADRVRAADGVVSDVVQRRWTAAALAAQQQFLAEMAEQGVVAKPALRFTRLVNGFSAIADPSAVALLERSPDVAGVYPVRAAFPAAPDDVALDAMAPSTVASGLTGYSGRGVTVALLDTAVDPASPFLHGAVLPGHDVVSGGVAARYDQPPGGTRLETHGTAMAGIVAGLGGAGRPSGVAPGATVLPVRVAGWQRDAAGIWSVHARTDQMIAGLELAVDPDRDGDAHDAARVTVVPLVEPFAAFPDGPLARAVEGATALDSLVVAPAGNDGPGGPVFGSIAGPGGAPAALTVGAAELRPAVARMPALVRSGLRVLARRPLDVLTAAAPPPGTFGLVPVDDPAQLFAGGVSRLAGRAALFTSPISPRRAATLADRAGARMVVLAGGELPPGALGLEPRLPVPVLAGGAALSEELADAGAGKRLWLSLEAPQTVSTPGVGRAASFSSWGLAFGGELKPDVVAPGVGIVSAMPGADHDGRSPLVSVSGGSAAAAVTAGLAARLAQARPALDAEGLRSALVGTARAIGRPVTTVHGTGLVDAGRAAEVEVVTSPATVSFGRASGDGWVGRRALLLRNVSTRPVTVYLAERGSLPGIVFELSRRRFEIPAGARARVWLRVRLVRRPPVSAVNGSVRVAPRGGRALTVPWALVLAAPPDDLLGPARLSEAVFSPSDLTPAVLAVRIGTIARVRGRNVIEPVRRFDVLLEDGKRRPLGLLARLRDVLPGRYAFGITGRGPDGRFLAAGDYRLRLLARPAAGGRAAVRTVPFRVDRSGP